MEDQYKGGGDMLNGSCLKMAFLMIVGTLCIMSAVLTLGTAFKLIQFDTYVQLIGELGVGSLFGGIVQAFIHANINDNGGSNVQSDKPVVAEPTKVQGSTGV